MHEQNWSQAAVGEYTDKGIGASLIVLWLVWISKNSEYYINNNKKKSKANIYYNHVYFSCKTTSIHTIFFIVGLISCILSH